MEEPVKLLRGAEYLTDDGKIELLSDGIEQVKKAHAAGRNVLVEVDDREVLLEAKCVPTVSMGVVWVKYSVAKFQKPLPRSCQRDPRAC